MLYTHRLTVSDAVPYMLHTHRLAVSDAVPTATYAVSVSLSILRRVAI